MPLPVLYNPLACNGKSLSKLKPALPLLEERFGKTILHSLLDHSDQLHYAVSDSETVVIAGGDGTFHRAVNDLPGLLDKKLIFISAGSGNDFARYIYGTPNPKQQARLLAEHRIEQFDTLDVNGRRVLEVAGIGFDGQVSLAASRFPRWIPASLKYMIGIALWIWRYPSRNFSIDTGTGAVEYSALLCSCGNGPMAGGGFRLMPGADITDGLLQAVLLKKISLTGRIRYLISVLRADHLKLPATMEFNTDRIHIRTDIPTAYHLDGEPQLASEWEIKVIPKSLSVIVPARWSSREMP